ncbi:response regulator [Altericista sp. CCNU0014]|uniref:response regulator n=1 Tax=Altericista sp. CCNU0014 TaxID=3082949 RepID=UPI00384C4922
MTAKRLLLIDDEENLVSVIQICLQKLGGWTVLTASSGTEGLRHAEALQPDAILLDVMMPDLDGLTVLRRLKANPSTQNIPVILLTAKMQSAHQSEYAQLDIAGVLAKPFDPLDLAKRVAKILGW